MFYNKNKDGLPAVRHGFTLVELLVVIGIIALLSTLATMAVFAARNTAKIKKSQSDLAAIAKGIEMLVLDTGEWPGHDTPYVVCATDCDANEMEDLNVASAGLMATDGSFSGWIGPYMQILTLDPWGNNYFYDSDYDVAGTDKAVIGSYGPNGQGLNLYDSDDIIKIISY